MPKAIITAKIVIIILDQSAVDAQRSMIIIIGIMIVQPLQGPEAQHDSDFADVFCVFFAIYSHPLFLFYISIHAKSF